MKFLALDIETGGLDRSCSVLEVAFVEGDTEDLETPINDLPLYRQIFKPRLMVIDPWALRQHTRSGLLAECFANGADPEWAWEGIRGYLDQYAIRHGLIKPVIAGKNVAGFDLQFFPEQVRSQVHYRTIDIGSLFLGLGGKEPPSLSDILSEIVHPDARARPEVTHTALEDARDVVRAIRAWAKQNR